MASKQEEYISGDEIENFIELSRKRDRLQHEISANNRRSDNNNEKNGSLSMEIVDVIKSIQETDKRIEKFIIEKKENILVDIKKVRKGQRAIKSYGGKPLQEPRFIRKKG